MDKQFFINLLIAVVIVIPFSLLFSYLLWLPYYLKEKRKIERGDIH